MKLLYEPNTREVWYAVDDKDINTFSYTTNLPLSEFLIDEKNDAVITTGLYAEWGGIIAAAGHVVYTANATDKTPAAAADSAYIS